MMYTANVVAVVKVNGQVLRENSDTVTLPFGSEFSLLVKNLNSVRIQFSVSIDGKDATDGTKLIVGPNSNIELERFVRNGNLQAGCPNRLGIGLSSSNGRRKWRNIGELGRRTGW